MTRSRAPKAFDVLLLWHGLFAGSYAVAYLTAEGGHGLHQFAGYCALGLLAIRLLAALSVGEKGPWALPWPRASQWRTFGRKLVENPLAALRSRTPLSPLSGLVLLGTLVLVVLTGLTAHWWEWEDLHEGPAEASLAIVLVHIAIVTFGPLLRKLQSPVGARAGQPVRSDV